MYIFRSFKLFGAPQDNEAEKLNFHKKFMIIIHNWSKIKLSREIHDNNSQLINTQAVWNSKIFFFINFENW